MRQIQDSEVRMKYSYNIIEVLPGKYALRRRNSLQRLFNVGGEYRYLQESDYWTENDVRFKPSCLTEDLASIQESLKILKTIPKVIE